MAVTGKKHPFDGRYQWIVGGVLVLLGGWFAWGAWGQAQAERKVVQLEAVRDDVMGQTASALQRMNAQLGQALATDSIQAALKHGNTVGLQMDLGQIITGIHTVRVEPAHLGAAYSNPPAFGWSRLALLERAAMKAEPVSAVVSEAGSPMLGLAVPATVSGTESVLYLSLPLSRLSALIDQADVPDGAYVGLRQGNYLVAEKGDAELAARGDVMARPVGVSGLRVVAGVQDAPPPPLGMGVAASVLVALLLWMVAALVILGDRLQAVVLARKRMAQTASEDQAETLSSQHMSAGNAAVPSAAPVRSEAAFTEAPAIVDPAAEPVATEVIDATMFRAYDIRGVVGKGLDRASAQRIGQAIGSELQARGLREIVVGRDGRLSGEELAGGLIDGLRLSGCDVIDIGLAPSPVAYFACYHLRTGSCVVVTGSHNPPEYNGFKIVLGGETLSGEAISALHARIVEGNVLRAESEGTLSQQDVQEDYISRIAGDVQLERPLKVVVDAGNGVAGLIAPALLESIGAEVIPLYCDVDGHFPNHHPDPSDPHTLDDLVATVKRFGADVGVAFDGDGDRLGVVTPEGTIVYADRLLMLFAADVLMRNPGAQIIYDVKCSGLLADYVLRNGGSPLMWKTGHSLIKAKMRETDAELAGEMSGHFFFKERWFGFDDGMYAAARLLEILAQRDDSVDDVLREIPEAMATPEIKVSAEGGGQHALVALFTAAAQSPQSSLAGARLTTIDGLRADYPDGWGLLRASNTTSALVLRFEGRDEAALERIRQCFRQELEPLLPGSSNAF